MRKAEELSITIAPACAATGAHSLLADAPAEKSAMSTPLKISADGTSVTNSRPLKVITSPRLRGEASGTSSLTGKLRSSSTLIMVLPTRPVAPRTATR
jgi:hypothetical protein